MLNFIRTLRNNYRTHIARKDKLSKIRNELAKKNPVLENGHNLLMDVIYLHCTSNGKDTEYLDKFTRSQKRYDLSGLGSIFSADTWAQKDSLLEQLKKEGFCILPERISSEKCDEIIELASNIEFTPKSFKDKVFEDTLFRPPFVSAKYDLGPDRTLQYEEFQEFIADPFFIEMASEYLQGPPILDPVQLWWSAPFGLIDDEFAQNYHFDMDSLKWFKVFINFEDITVKNGPHSFIKGSHLPGKQSEKIRSKFYSRISDEDVYENYGKESEILFTVPKGSILIEDTKGMHKGYHVEEGRRLLLSFQYSNVVFSKPEKPYSLPEKLNSNFKTLIERHPEFAAKFYDLK
jgi:hypothetical protein